MEIIPFSCVYNRIRQVRLTAMGPIMGMGRTNLQHRQALFRGSAAEEVDGSGEDDMG